MNSVITHILRWTDDEGMGEPICDGKPFRFIVYKTGAHPCPLCARLLVADNARLFDSMSNKPREQPEMSYQRDHTRMLIIFCALLVIAFALIAYQYSR